VQDADPGRAVRLVAGPGVEIGVDRPQINRNLRDRLTPVDEDDGTCRVRPLDDVCDGIDRADDVRDVDEGEQLGPPSQQRVERVEVELTVVEHRDVRELRAAVGRQQLPRDDVGVVLHLGEHDQVAGVDVCAAPRVRHEVDRRRRVGREDRLLGRRSKPFGDAAACAFEQIGRLHGERVHAPMNRRAGLGVVPGHRVDHRLRRLRCRRGVEVRDGVPAELPPQHRELRGDVPQSARRDGGHG
jgi:hypothetical protein